MPTTRADFRAYTSDASAELCTEFSQRRHPDDRLKCHQMTRPQIGIWHTTYPLWLLKWHQNPVPLPFLSGAHRLLSGTLELGPRLWCKRPTCGYGAKL